MRQRRTGRRRPPWWPANEPWPPHGPPLRRARGTILRRAALVGATLLSLMLSAGVLAVWLVVLALRWLGLTAVSVPLALGGLIVAAIMPIAFGLRRAVRPLDVWLEAAGRVEAGDYAARVPERGPREVRRLARAFNSMTVRLEEDEARRRSLLADITHELRTPLTVIQGQIEAILDGVYPADEGHLAPVLDESRVLSRLIDDLRTLSLADGGALRLHPEPTDLGVLAAESAAAFRGQAEAAGVALRVQVDENVPLAQIDPVRIREVLSNLLANAIRYTPPGGAVSIQGKADPAFVTVTVTDTGTGIAPEALPSIFDRFYRSGESRGSGLGLAIAKNLVEAHGGQIAASSELGEGTIISIRLPAGE